MIARHLAIGLLFLSVAIVPAILTPYRSPAAGTSGPPDIPAEALEAMEQGRYWRASRILRGYLAAVPDTTPETILLAAQAEAGWGGWTRVESLLADRPWLDDLAGGYGWNLLGRSRVELGEYADGGAALGRYLTVAAGAGERARGLAEVRRARALMRADDPEAAVRAFDRAKTFLPQLGDWMDVFAARAAARAGDTATVAQRLDGIDPVLAREWGWRYRVRAYREADDPAGALRAAEAATNALDDAGRRAAAWVTVGDLRLVQRDTATARSAFHRAMSAAPRSLAAVDAARNLSTLPGLSPDDHLRIGRLYLRNGNLARAKAGLAAYLDSGRGSARQRAQVRLDLGRALFRAGEYAEAERRLLDLAETAPAAHIGASAMFQAGRAQYRQGRSGAGRATFLRTAERFPRTDAAAKALFLVADLDHDDGKLDTARTYYRRTIDINPSINEAGLAMMRLGGLAFSEGDHLGAAKIFEEYRRRHPNGRRYSAATYWAARAYLEMGQPREGEARLRNARNRDPLSYYGVRAAERLNQPILDIPMAPSPPRSAAVDAEVATAVARIDALRTLELTDAADFEVERLREHFMQRDGALYSLAEALNARGYTFTGIRLGWKIHEREGVWNPRLLRIIYPMPYRTLILAEARDLGVDPFLVAGLIRQESMFNADIKSHAGAVGLMQIMPATGRALARTVGLNGFHTGLLERPEINVHLGITYLVELLDRFDGRLPDVLAAYNAGPHRVNRWSQFPEYAEVETFTERIPYSETRHYVKVVQKNARLYAELYEDAVTAPPPPAKVPVSGDGDAADADADS